MTREFQKKRLAKVLLLIYVVLIIFCATSCSSARKKKLNKILPDVDYDFVIFNRDNVIINGTHYDINELAYDVSGKKTNVTSPFPFLSTTTCITVTNTKTEKNFSRAATKTLIQPT